MPRKKTTDALQRVEVVKDAVEVSGYELAAALLLIAFGAAPLAFSWWILLKRDFNLSEWVTLNVLGLYAFLVIETFSVFLLYGFRRLNLPESIVKWLGATAFGEVAGLAVYVVKQAFK